MTRHFFLDIILVSVALAGVNAIAAPGDPGFTSINPSPWILIPLIAGARYGFKSGLVTGCGIALLIGAARVLCLDKSLAAVFEPYFFYLALPTVGVLSGEIRGLLSRRATTAESQLQQLQARHHQLATGLDIAETARFQLQERVALTGSHLASLDVQLRTLFEPGSPPIFDGLLRLLRDTCGILEAAIYVPAGNVTWQRAALLGEPTALPELLQPHAVQITRYAIERGDLVTCRHTVDHTPGTDSPYIAALPWLGGDRESIALLLVSRMEFLSIKWSTFAQLQTICQWVSMMLAIKLQSGRDHSTPESLFTPEEGTFYALLEAAQTTHAQHRLPSSVISLTFQRPPAAEDTRALLATVLPLLRATDVTTWLTTAEHPSLVIFLPFASHRDATTLLTRVQAALITQPALAASVALDLSQTDGEQPIPPTA